MSYNSLIYTEQGGGVMRFESGAALHLGDSQFYFGSDLPTFAAVAGAVYFRGGVDAGSAANIYINITNSASTGAVWKGASLFS